LTAGGGTQASSFLLFSFLFSSLCFLYYGLLHRESASEDSSAAAMGIKQLFQIVKEEAPDAIKEGEIKNQFGRKVAIVR
jgi:hypothetical protein